MWFLNRQRSGAVNCFRNYSNAYAHKPIVPSFTTNLFMRNLLSILTAIVVVTSCKKEKVTEVPEVAQNKDVTYHVFAAKNYTGTPAENVQAELRLQLRIINYRTGEQRLIWDSLMPARRLIDFPLFDQKVVIKKVHPVLNSYQKLNGSYSVIYRDGQLINQEGKSNEAGPGTASILLEAGM
jgi:hypothetical protein